MSDKVKWRDAKELRDRIEFLEMKLATALALIETLEGEQARADALEAQLQEARLSELAALSQAGEAYDKQKELEAKLAKLVEALDENEGSLL